jgi:hypothetical protein
MKAYTHVRTDFATAAAVATYCAANPTKFMLGSRIVAADGSVSVVIDSSGTTQLVPVVNASAVTAENAAGLIGTAAVPSTYRWTENGIITTMFKIDLTGLASVATANDVIGLAAGGVAYIRQNLVATDGIVFKNELVCLETPAGGDDDVNVVLNASGTLEYNGAGGTTYGVNGGDAAAGQTVQNLVPSATANHYYYLTAGTGDTAAAYTAGQFMFITYGHAVLA